MSYILAKHRSDSYNRYDRADRDRADPTEQIGFVQSFYLFLKSCSYKKRLYESGIVLSIVLIQQSHRATIYAAPERTSLLQLNTSGQLMPVLNYRKMPGVGLQNNDREIAIPSQQ